MEKVKEINKKDPTERPGSGLRASIDTGLVKHQMRGEKKVT